MSAKQFPALALDGNNRQADVIASDAGQLLMTGILDATATSKVAQRIMQSDMFSGFGIRTLSAEEKRFSPCSYHDGSVWPHDNSLIASGLHAAAPDEANRIIEGMLAVAASKNYFRLPELFCGTAMVPGKPPQAYPVACIPQAWAGGSMLMMLTSNIGLSIDAGSGCVKLCSPKLPPGVSKLRINNLKVGAQSISIRVRASEGKLLVESSTEGGSFQRAPNQNVQIGADR